MNETVQAFVGLLIVVKYRGLGGLVNICVCKQYHTPKMLILQCLGYVLFSIES